MIVLVLTAIGVATAVPSTRRLRRLAELPLRGLWLVWAAFVTQVLLFEFVGYYIPVVASNVVHLATYALCLLFLWRNRALTGMWVIIAGTACNLAAIVANGGTMPASAEAWARAGLPDPTAFENSSFETGSRLGLLGDVFWIPSGWPLANVFSIGDVLIVLGGTYLAHRWCAGADDPADEPTDDLVDVAVGPDPVPADVRLLAAAFNEFRADVLAQLDATRLETQRRLDEARLVHEVASDEIAATRAALVTLLADIEARTASPQGGHLPARALEEAVAEQRRALERLERRQAELADLLVAVIDTATA